MAGYKNEPGKIVADGVNQLVKVQLGNFGIAIPSTNSLSADSQAKFQNQLLCLEIILKLLLEI